MSSPAAILPAAHDASAVRAPTVRIRPSRGWVSLRLKEVWAYRELLFFLTWRDVRIRYKQTALGASWAVLQPLLTMVIFSLFFGRLARVPSDDLPYPLFALAALVPWTFFANGLTLSSNSLVGSANLITKVYFPRLAIPVAAVISSLVDLGLGLAVLGCMMVYYALNGGLPHRTDVAGALAAVFPGPRGRNRPRRGFVAVGPQRQVPRRAPDRSFHGADMDVRHAYCLSEQSAERAVADAVRPEPDDGRGGRDALGLAGAKTAPGPAVAVSAAAALALLVSGAYAFRRLEKSFADLV